MPKLRIDGRSVEVEEGQTVLDACRKLGIEVPTMCHAAGQEHYTSCMICMVQEARGKRLIPSCSMPAGDGMDIDTECDAVREARKTALELLLSDHLGDCEGPCQRTCPAGMNIPLMIRQIHAGQLAAALATVKRDIALPAILGRICPAPCEKACRRKQVDDAVGICTLKRYAADTDLAQASPYRPECAADSGKKVAIAGAGPAGLAAAYYLRRRGHACVVFEKGPAAGGGLRTSELASKLPASVIDAEIGTIESLGIEFRLSSCVGRDIPVDQLKRDFDAVVLTVGSIPEPGEAVFGVAVTPKGLKVQPRTGQTSDPAVFAGGNAVTGKGKMAIRACADGKAVAAAVDQYLCGEKVTGEQKRFNSVIGKIQDGEKDALMAEADRAVRVPVEIGAPDGFTRDQATQEAARCMHCDCRKPESCRLRRYAEEYGAAQNTYKGLARREFTAIREHPRVVFESGKCILCGICTRIAEQAGERPGLAFIKRGFAARISVPFGDSFAEALPTTAEECARRCPTGAFALRDAEETGEKAEG